MNEDSSPSAEELTVAMEEAIKQSTTDLTKMLDNINANTLADCPDRLQQVQLMTSLYDVNQVSRSAVWLYEVTGPDGETYD